MGTEKVSWKSATSKEIAVRLMGGTAGLIMLAAIGAHLAGVEFRGALSFLNNRGFWILITPALAPFVLFRHGSWTGWKVVESSTLVSALCRFGWTNMLFVGVVEFINGR